MKNSSLLKLFLELIKIDSVSGEEQEIRNFIISLLKKKKLTYKIDTVGNLFIKKKGSGKPIMLCGHLDTVEPGRGVKPVVEDKIIKSDGKTILGADNKAFVSVLVDILVNEQIDRYLEIILSVKEETGGGLDFFPFSWLRSKQGIIFDNANPIGGIVLRSPEITNFSLEFLGKASHVATPEKGINSLLPAVEFLGKIKKHLTNTNKKISVNIGLVHSGTAINTIPEKTVIKGEIRSYDQRKFNFSKTLIKEIFFQAKKVFKGEALLTFDGYCPGYHHQKNDPFIKKIASVIKKNQLTPYYLKRSGISDGNILNSHQIKTVVLSDGVINPHTRKEKIKIADLFLIKKLVLDFATQI